MEHDLESYLDHRYIVPVVVALAVAVVLVLSAGDADTSQLTDGTPTVPGSANGDGEKTANQLYTTEGDQVVLHPDRYLDGTPHTVDSGTFRMQYAYNGSNYSSAFTVKGKYRGRPITQWGYEQTDDDMRITAAIDPTDGAANAFIFPPQLVEQAGEQRLEGIAVIDQAFREQAGNVSIARYGGTAHRFDGQKIGNGVYKDTYIVTDLQNYFLRGNRRIMVGTISTGLYNRIDSDGIGVYLED